MEISEPIFRSFDIIGFHLAPYLINATLLVWQSIFALILSVDNIRIAYFRRMFLSELHDVIHMNRRPLNYEKYLIILLNLELNWFSFMDRYSSIIKPINMCHRKDIGMSEWVIKLNGLSGDSWHRGPYSPYEACNHIQYIGMIIFRHIDNPQSTVPLSWLVNGDGNSTSVYIYSKLVTSSLGYNKATYCNNKPTRGK